MAQTTSMQHSEIAAIDAGAVLRWYDRHARYLPWRVSPADRAKGAKPNPYFVWLSEIMLQQTTIAAVRKYFAAFTSLWPTVEDLAAAPLDDVLVQWAGLGYYARARNLHACAVAVVAHHGGVFPKTASALRDLPGIGDYTSAAIAAICHDEQVAVIDGNVDRVVARYLALPSPVREEKPLVRATVQHSVPPRAGDFAQAMMDLGATICAPRRANCLLCPLEPDCLGTKTGNPLAFPVPPKKSEKPRRHGHAFIIRNPNGKVFLRQRGPKGMLAKMTETPGSEWTETRLAPAFPFINDWHQVGEVLHTFTHFHLTLTVWSVTADTPLDEGWWAEETRLDGEALPSLFRKVLKTAGIE
ncbi:A/G-specific adenine glycosylase [Pelagibacterium halotolerans]|uniref:Adenine DNA glycosylase n=1 Tax=Pelagibacterium halotolerans (strain DSM 22347 / JCM 15775 / CGMCC 1.7692 / B2) TaxID=1082931 RepID=G4RB57_PELHB|nr:A/G-specific adenine glycosylase [Pelagibacterium halotolerans]AEQ50566.1 A/G-specific adenine glycosylase [Pelagibacterium halotolerans B2]QJR19487.1 A/G-specific adenine glycosylase [Pelagibacterium halotolerans]SDZ89945.1 A/G-specific DNA-adenine glycosylase [Pelagibacterium halotolerans]